MSLNEKTVYPQLAEIIAADELAVYFTPTDEEIVFVMKSARMPASRLSLLVLLKVFQKLHRFPDRDEMAASVVDHLASNCVLERQCRSRSTTPFSGHASEPRSASTRALRVGPNKPATLQPEAGATRTFSQGTDTCRLAQRSSFGLRFLSVLFLPSGPVWPNSTLLKYVVALKNVC